MSDTDARLIALKRIADELYAMRHTDLKPHIKWELNHATASLDLAILKMGETPRVNEPVAVDPVFLKARDNRRTKNDLTAVAPLHLTDNQVRHFLDLNPETCGQIKISDTK